MERILILAIPLSALIYFFSNPKPQSYYDYTFRVAANMLGGNIAFTSKQPPWLNEFVPVGTDWYSVFPFGAVVSMMPAAVLKTLGLITDMPGIWIAAIQAGVIAWFLLKIAAKYEVTRTKQLLLMLAILFGTFMWTNLTVGGAWQLALGFAMVGELGAIYFTVFERRPIIAGIFFAIAFGNRTENLLTAPVFFYLLNRGRALTHRDPEVRVKEKRVSRKTSSYIPLLGASSIKAFAEFCAVPFVLGVVTLIYNYVRFSSFTDFGYARIPGVLSEPWYDHGIFSTTYIPRQAWEMLIKPWEWRTAFPYLLPDRFSSSILWSSPFLLLILRVGARDGALKLASWAAFAILTFLLWIHGNSGGWQFGYRYAMILLPWAFVLMLESAKKHITPVEWTLIVISFAANIYATWLFHWTEYMK